jgi:heme A synthase
MLGAFVIVERLHAILVTAHLGLGLVLFAMVLIIVLYSYGLLLPDRRQITTTRDKGSEKVLEKEEHANPGIVNDSNDS